MKWLVLFILLLSFLGLSIFSFIEKETKFLDLGSFRSKSKITVLGITKSENYSDNSLSNYLKVNSLVEPEKLIVTSITNKGIPQFAKNYIKDYSNSDKLWLIYKICNLIDFKNKLKLNIEEKEEFKLFIIKFIYLVRNKSYYEAMVIDSEIDLLLKPLNDKIKKELEIK